MLTTQKTTNCKNISKEEVKRFNEVFLALKIEAVDEATYRLGYFDEYTGNFEIELPPVVCPLSGPFALLQYPTPVLARA